MLGYVARRLGLAIGTVFAAVLITFLLVHVGEGSPGAVVAGPGATPEEIAAENEALGWNQPLITQFVNLLGQLLRFDLGQSLINGRDIAADMADRLPVTASIALMATLASGVVGVLLGVAGRGPGGRRRQDREHRSGHRALAAGVLGGHPVRLRAVHPAEPVPRDRVRRLQ